MDAIILKDDVQTSYGRSVKARLQASRSVSLAPYDAAAYLIPPYPARPHGPARRPLPAPTNLLRT